MQYSDFCRAVGKSTLSVVTCCLLSSMSTCGQTNDPPSRIFRNARPSIVLIIGGDKSGNPTVQGSGFIIGRNQIVTNHHVVAGTFTVMAVFSDGASSPITSVISDSASKDLIILGASTSQRPALPLGDELSLEQGEAVYAIGAPRGLELTLTDGIVSAFRNMDEQFLIQSTAAIGHGSSGGPLFNREGKVVGITSSLLSDTPGIYFSVGVGDLKRLLRNPQLLVLDFSDWSKRNANTPSTNGSGDIASSRTTRTSLIEELISSKKFDEARTALQTLEAEEPDTAITHRLIGEFDQKTGNADAALRELQLSVEKDPSDSSSQFYFSISLYYARRFDEALAHEVKSNELTPTASDPPLLAALYYAVRDYKRAAEMEKRALDANPNSELALSVLAGLEFHRVSVQEESAWPATVQHLLSLDPDNFWVHVSQGYDHLTHSRIEEAKVAFNAAENDSFPDPAPYLALAHLYISQSDFGRANDEIKAGLSEFPEDAQLLSSGMFVSLITRDNMEATRRFQRLQKSYPGSREALSEGCLYYYGIGQSTAALPFCSRLADQFPGDRVAHSNYGWAALDADQFQLASNEFSKAYTLASADWTKLTDNQTIDLLWGCALAHYNSKDTKTASELVQLIRKNHPTAATITGLQQLPLLWSSITLGRIETALREFPR
jgi:tetratricopeptide (TPR) repeat protein